MRCCLSRHPCSPGTCFDFPSVAKSTFSRHVLQCHAWPVQASVFPSHVIGWHAKVVEAPAFPAHVLQCIVGWDASISQVFRCCASSMQYPRFPKCVLQCLFARHVLQCHAQSVAARVFATHALQCYVQLVETSDPRTCFNGKLKCVEPPLPPRPRTCFDARSTALDPPLHSRLKHTCAPNMCSYAGLGKLKRRRAAHACFNGVLSRLEHLAWSIGAPMLGRLKHPCLVEGRARVLKVRFVD